MIIEKIWHAFKAQVNKLANLFHGSDPIAQMQYEYDSAVAQLREGRQGLEQYRALVERVMRQVNENQAQVNNLEAKVKLYLQNGDRDTAGKFALELQKAKKQLAENQEQQKMHEEAYNNNLLKIKHAGDKIKIAAAKLPKFTPGAGFKAAVDPKAAARKAAKAAEKPAATPAKKAAKK